MEKGFIRFWPIGAALTAIVILGGIIIQRVLARESGDLIVPTLYGEVQGKSLRATNAWLGIPYAGARRWQPPQAPEKWDGVKPAFQFGAACMQLPPDKGAEAALAHGAMSEDCLTLNVWRPKGSEQSLPVMVWIHGGAFRLGSSSLALYNGEALAAKGVVVVSINYRLGPFSVFPHSALRDKAMNFGLLDQVAALGWVKRNIASFGGNPDNVTVWGESAGGASVGYLMTSPLSRGLFNKAIIQSGALDLPELDHQQAQAALERVLPADLRAKNAQQLRALPATQLLHLPLSKTVTMPIVDGVSLTEKTCSAFAAGHLHKMPLLIGSNDYEAGFFPPQWAASVPAKLGALWPQARALTDGYGSGRD
ncbi:carboxylesterase family protein, partial [Pantoea sp.]